MKKFKKIVLAAGTGQIGRALVKHFANKCDELVILSRSEAPAINTVRTVKWDGKNAGDWWRELENAEVLINLAGKNINCRYTEANKKEIIESRVDSIMALANAAEKCQTPPALWIQSASGAIYNHNNGQPKREGDAETGGGFLADVCRIWETTFLNKTTRLHNMRKVTLRISLVLGNKGGAYPELKKLVKLGLGGKAGSGQQYMSWLVEEDLANVVEWIMEHKELQGPVNCATPGALSNADFMRTMRSELHRPFGLPSPAIALKLGAYFMGTEADLILGSMWQYPEKLMQSGFQFKYPNLKEAIYHLNETK